MAVAEPITINRKIPWQIFLAAGLMLAGLALSQALKPTRVLADELPPIVLEQLVPRDFGDWRIDESAPPVMSDPTLEATIASLYSATLNRTYRNRQGQAIMLALAYGRNQNSWSTAAHRPEFCYSAQGFTVDSQGLMPMQLGSHAIDVERLVARRGSQVEPISYWVTLANTATTPGVTRKVQQIRYGLQGLVVDGFLVRVSSWESDPQAAYKLHERFVKDWESAMPSAFRPRFFGS